MEYKIRRIEDVLLIQVEGRIDHKTAETFESGLKPHLDDCVAGKIRKILLDLGGVDFMTSSGLRVLMIAAKTCAKQRSEIAVANLQPIIEEIFKISRFDLVLKIFPSVQTALKQLSPAAATAYNSA